MNCMGSNETGQQYLNQFDTLNISKKHQRRVGVYVLKEFYASVMVDVRREYLSIDEGIKRDPITTQWGRMLTRIEALEDVPKLDNADDLLPTLKKFRNKTHHNTDYNPPKRQLEQIRELAPLWREWLIKYSRQYHEYREELDPHGTIVEMTEKILQDIRSEQMMNSSGDDELEEIGRKAESLLEQLNRLTAENTEITIDLLNILKDALAVRKELERCQRNPELLRDALYDFYNGEIEFEVQDGEVINISDGSKAIITEEK